MGERKRLILRHEKAFLMRRFEWLSPPLSPEGVGLNERRRGRMWGGPEKPENGSTIRF